MIDFVPLQYYTWVYYWLMACLCMATGIYYLTDYGCRKLLTQNSGVFAFILCAILTVYVGLRPISGRYFVDMKMYAHSYRYDLWGENLTLFDVRKEWFFAYVMKFCKISFNNVYVWFLVIDIFYFGCQLWACKKLLKENAWMAIMFVFFSYQFYTFGVNGLRNGMACALMMLAIAYWADRDIKGYLIGFFIFLLALGCHRSTALPMAALFVSTFIIKDIRTAILIWVGCIFASLLAGGVFQAFVSSIGFDDRMASYSSAAMNQFSHTGFRWDFLLYSSMPVLLAGYIRSRNIQDRTFSLLANTYIIANSFWVLICRVAFSNRFAYLSWFLYALVLAYGVIRVPVWKDQDRMAGWVLLAHTAFTFGMFFIGK